MTKKSNRRKLNRRDFLKFAGGTLATAAGARLLPRYLGKNVLKPTRVEVASAQTQAPDLYIAGTDGWVYLPETPAIPPFHPDDLAPAPLNHYIFGFRNVTGLDEARVRLQKLKAQASAPLFWTEESVPFHVQLTNLGLGMRPDLIDDHTIHWHGFRNAIPFFDGEPNSSVAIPIGRHFTYVYNAHDPGTYMYHCHVEEVEHIHMGMTGMLFVRPAQNGNTTLYPSGKYIFNCGDGSTGYDREYAMLLTEAWAEAHWADSHIQLPEWSDYAPEFYMINGRSYPDTLAPNGSLDPFNEVRDANGDLIAPPGHPQLKYQPYSSLIQCKTGERVLLRFANLGFLQQAMTLTGITMKVHGKDATFLRSRDGTDIRYETNTIVLDAGASYDVIFEAPPYVGPGPYDTYLLYNRDLSTNDNLIGSGYGGQMTEVHVYPPTATLSAQSLPNEWAQVL
ncbi:MAG: multicopper oxidase domain-containing protein [Anaerolineae bacterium]